MKRNEANEGKRGSYALRSSIGVTLSSLLVAAPVVKVGAIVIIATGAVAITSALIERKLARRNDGSANALSFAVKTGLVVAGVIGVAYIILNNPVFLL